MINSDFLNGLQVKEAIKKIIAEIEKRGLGKGKINFRLRDVWPSAVSAIGASLFLFITKTEFLTQWMKKICLLYCPK